MNVPMSWIKQYVDLDCDVKKFEDEMTMSGSKVESVTLLAHEIKNVLVGQITKIEKHPDADKLVVCQVDLGEKQLQIVTGATNVFESAYVPVAVDGAILKDGFKIKNSKLRGVPSQGMMCSVEELGFTKNDYPESPENGIYIFKEPQPLGADVVELLQMKDEVVEFEITSNRPDCYSIFGLAREAAATFDQKLVAPNCTPKETAEGDIAKMIQVSIENEALCSRYVARVVKNVKIEPSPLWMRHRLTAAGVKPINNIVDITNYVMLELGQPMHAFNIDTVAQGQIIVRNAKKDETFITLDGVERQLDETMLVIADPQKALAIAGIMGGENSKVTEDAGTILFESACFNGTRTRHTSKKLGLRTDASAKFEKGLDPNLALLAINRAMALVEELGCGEVVKGVVDAYPCVRQPWTVSYDPERINALLGTALSAKEMENILARLEIKAENNVASIPTGRIDLQVEADIAEEVARIYGYNNIQTTLATGTPTVGKKSYTQLIEDLMKETLVANGLCEAMNYSFESPKVFDKLSIPKESPLRQAVLVSNPLGEDYSVMRTTTLNGMLQSLATNYKRRNETAYLFEMARVYLPKALPLTELPEEKLTLTIGMYGKIDFYNIKSVVESLLDCLGIEADFGVEKSLPQMHPGRTAQILIKEAQVGYVGEVHPEITDNYGINTKTYIAVIDVSALFGHVNLERSYKQLAKFPSVARDLAMVVKEDVFVKEIETVIRKNGGKLLETVTLFDVYRGAQVGEGLKSVAYNITFRANDRTLTDDEINPVIEKMIKGLKDQLDASIRDK